MLVCLRAARGDDRPIAATVDQDLPDGWRLPSWVEGITARMLGETHAQAAGRNAHADRHGDVVARDHRPGRDGRRGRGDGRARHGAPAGLRPRDDVGGRMGDRHAAAPWPASRPPSATWRRRARGCRSPARPQPTAKRSPSRSRCGSDRRNWRAWRAAARHAWTPVRDLLRAIRTADGIGARGIGAGSRHAASTTTRVRASPDPLAHRPHDPVHRRRRFDAAERRPR